MPSEPLQKSLSAVLIFCLGGPFTSLGCSANDDYAQMPHNATHEGPILPALHEAPEETIQETRDCVKQHVSSSGGNFVIDLSADVTHDGQALSARVMSSNLRDADLEQCILKAVARMRVSPEILESLPTEPVSMSPQSRAQMGIAIPNPAIVLAGFLVVYGISVMIQITLRVVLSSPSAPTIPTPVAAATTTTAPIATATTTTTSPPIAIPRRNPGQTCDDSLLDKLSNQKKDICYSEKWGCKDEFENLGKKNQKLFTCAEILSRIARGTACLNVRKQIQAECYAGSPEPGHDQEITQIITSLTRCIEKAAVRGPGGGPC